MVYNFKEYKALFDTPAKRQQELAIARKIMDLLNKNKYDNLEVFIDKNRNYQDFLKNNNMTNVVKHFGNTLKEDDYNRILENLKLLSITKQSFNKDIIKTTNIDDKQFNTLEGQDKTYFINNSDSHKTIEEQMNDLQPTEEQFQTSDPNKNTENLFKELERRKQSLNPLLLSDINYYELNDNQRELFQIAYNYQQSINSTIKLDLNNQVMVDAENNIIKITKQNGETKIQKEDNIEEKVEEKGKSWQKQLTPNLNTIYSD